MADDPHRLRDGTQAGAGGKRLLVIVAAVAAVAVLAVFLLVMLLNGRPNEEIDPPHQNSAPIMEFHQR